MMNKRLWAKGLLSCIFSFLIFTSCEKVEYPGIGDKEFSFQSDILPMFSGCESCHGGENPKMGLNLEPGVAYESLNAKGLLDTVTGGGSTSGIYKKMKSGHAGGFEPIQLDKLEAWINQGAKNN